MSNVMFKPAISLVPGMMLARREEQLTDVTYLLSEYHKEALEAGLTECQSWSMLLGGAMQWLHVLVEQYAKEKNVEPDEIIRKMAMKALAFSNE